jgi:hypothetical protein
VAAEQPERPASQVADSAAQPHLPQAVPQAAEHPLVVSVAAQPAAQSRSHAVRWSRPLVVSLELWEE